MPRKKEDPEDWQRAGKEALTTMLKRAEVLASDATELKALESMIKVVAEVVGGAQYFGRRTSGTTEGGAPDDDDI